jgi:nuclear GTP-binding protein
MLIKFQNPQWRSKVKKDPGIPNLFPYKDKILAEVEEKRRLKEEETARFRQLAKEQRANGGAAATDPAEDFEEFDAEDNELLDDDSEDDDAMDMVGPFLSVD